MVAYRSLTGILVASSIALGACATMQKGPSVPDGNRTFDRAAVSAEDRDKFCLDSLAEFDKWRSIENYVEQASALCRELMIGAGHDAKVWVCEDDLRNSAEDRQMRALMGFLDEPYSCHKSEEYWVALGEIFAKYPALSK